MSRANVLNVLGFCSLFFELDFIISILLIGSADLLKKRLYNSKFNGNKWTKPIFHLKFIAFVDVVVV
jgi:hypothetical protein